MSPTPPAVPALALGLLLAACGGDGTTPSPQPAPSQTDGPATPAASAIPTEAPTASPTPPGTGDTPEGWRRIAVDEAGFSLAVPDGWQELSPDDIGESGVIEEMIAANPDSAAVLEQARAAIESGQIALFAFDPEGDSGFATNLNAINVGPVEGGAEQAAEEVAEVIRQQIPVTGEVETETTALPGGEAAIVRYAWELDAGEGSPTRVGVTQYAIVADDGTGFILSMSAAAAAANGYADTFRQIAESFRSG